MAAVLLAGGGVYVVTLGGKDGKPRQVAQNNSLPDTSQRLAPTNPIPPTQPAKPPEKAPIQDKDPPEKSGPAEESTLAGVAEPPEVRDPLRRLEPDPVQAPHKSPVISPPPRPPRIVYEKPAMWPPQLMRGLPPGDSRAAMTDGANNWRLTDWTTFRPVRKFVGHTGPVTCVAFTADRKRALTGSQDRTLRLWDLDTGECLAVFPQSAQPILDVAVSADGSKAISTDGGSNARLWDVEKRQVIGRLSQDRPVTAIALSPDGTRAALGTASPQGGDYKVLVCDAEKGNGLLDLRGHTDWITSVAFSPDSDKLVSGGKDRAVRFWDLKRNVSQGVNDTLPGPVVRVGFCGGGKKVLVEKEQGAWVLDCASRMPLGHAGREPNGSVCYNVDEAGTRVWSNVWQESQSMHRWEAKVNPEPVVVKPPPPPTPRPRPGRPERLAVPEAAAVAAAEKELRDEFMDEFRKTATQDRMNLANKLGRFNRPGEDSAKRYAALKEARDLWAEIGILDQAMQQASQLSSIFEVNPIQARWEALDKTVKSGGRFVIRPHPVDQALSLMEQARTEENYDLAAKILETARRSANKSGNPTQKLQVAHAEQEVAAIRAEHAKLKKNLEILATNPDNPEANLAVGRFRCCHQDKWAEGLPLLAKGSDAGLKAAAEKEIQDADTPAGCKKIADAWCDLVPRFTGPVQAALRQHAALWYRLAHPDPSVPMPQDIKARLVPLAKAMPELADPWSAFNVADASQKLDYYHLDPFRAITTKHSYRGAVDVTVVARTPKSNIRIAAGDGGLCIFNHEASGGVVLHRPDASGTADGRGQRGGSQISEGKPDVTVPENKFTLLRWRLTPKGQQVWIEGKLVYDVQEPYDLSYSSPAAVGNYMEPIDVRAVIVRGVATPNAAGPAKESP
jgi:hypothetical protein